MYYVKPPCAMCSENNQVVCSNTEPPFFVIVYVYMYICISLGCKSCRVFWQKRGKQEHSWRRRVWDEMNKISFNPLEYFEKWYIAKKKQILSLLSILKREPRRGVAWEVRPSWEHKVACRFQVKLEKQDIKRKQFRISNDRSNIRKCSEELADLKKRQKKLITSLGHWWEGLHHSDGCLWCH